MLKRAFRYRRYIFLVLAAQYLFVFFHRVSPAVVATDLMHTFRVGSGALGVLASAYFYPYAFMQIPAGILADRWGTRKTVTLFGSLAGIGAICFALSPNFGVAVLSRALVGFGLSAIFVPSMTLFCAWFSEKEYGIVSGIFIAIGGIGWLTAATPLALLVQKLGWVGAFILIGAITLVLTGITWLIVSDRPEDMGFPSMTEKKGERLSIGPIRAGCARVLSQRRFWPLAIYNLLTGVSLFGFCGLWAGPYLTDVYRLPGPRAANVLTMIAAALIFGGPFLTSLSEKVFHSRKRVLAGCSIAHLFCWLVLLMRPATLASPLLYAIFFVIGLTAGAVTPVVITATKELFPVEMAGISVGMVNMFPFLGGIISQPLIGLLLDSVRRLDPRPARAYQAVFLSFVVMSFGALWCIGKLRRTDCERKKSRPYPR